MRPAAKNNGRIDDIEYLRAVAIIFVLIGHSPALFGWYGRSITEFEQFFQLESGVDLFFVISGFVITTSYLRHDSARTRSFGLSAFPFWIRRAFRILPSAWFWIAFTFVAVVIFNRSGAFGDVRPTILDGFAGILEVANLHIWGCAVLGVGTCGIGGVPNGIYWSLSLEEQFYFIFPFVILLTPRRFLAPALLVAASVQIFSDKTGLAWFLRSDGLIIGVLLALWSRHQSFRLFEPRFLADPTRKLAAFVILAAATGFVGSPAASRFVLFSSGMTAVVCGLWVFIASFGKDYVIPWRGLDTIMLWIGARSYSLYLCHFSAYCVTREIWARVFGQAVGGSQFDLPFGITAAILLFVFAEGTHRMIETPMRNIGREIATRRLIRVLGQRHSVAEAA